MKVNCEFYPRTQYVTDPLIIDGFSRSGKFLMGHLVGAMERVEFMQNPILLETVLYLTRLNKLELKTARILVQADIDLNTYNMAIGRNLNGRIDDLSCIYKAVDFGKYLARATTNDPTSLINDFQKQDLLPLYIGHECLCNAKTLFYIYPSVRLINLQRDPLSLIMSWFNRGWGRRWGVDPKSVSIAFKETGGPVPWFGLNWSPSYSSLSEMDRIVTSISILSKLARQEYEALTLTQQKQVYFVAFNDILTKPTDVIDGVGSFLGRSPHSAIAGILGRERVPRVVATDQRSKLFMEIEAHLSPTLKILLEELVAEFDGYWMGLTKI